MNHPAVVELAMLADDALPSEQADSVASHAATCPECAARLAALAEEAHTLKTAIRMDFYELPQMPEFSRPVSLRGFALANVATGLLIWLAQLLWKTVFGEVIVNAASWFTSVYLPDIYAMSSNALLYLLTEGTAMLDAYLGLIVVVALAIATGGLLLRYHRTGGSGGLCVGLLVVSVLAAGALPGPAHALEIRQDEGVVNIPASETIDDTLVVAAEVVLIEGTVTGDVIAVGQSIDISGAVGGNLVTAGEAVKIRGSVGGMILGASSSIDFDDATVGGDIWLAGESISVDEESRFGGNATIAGQIITMAGEVSRDLYAFSETVEIDGTLGEDLEAFGNRVRLLGNAVIGGDVRFRSSDEDKLYRADSAQVAGEIEFTELPEGFEPENRYTTVEFYLWQFAKLIGAFLVGWALLSLVPSLGGLSVSAGIQGFKSAGIGLLALVSVPIIAALVAVTLIGLPIALIILLMWILGVYLAHIVVASMIGRMLMPANDSIPQTLLVGLLVVYVAIALPFIGGVIGFVLTVIGLGLLVEYLYRLIARRDDDGGIPEPA